MSKFDIHNKIELTEISMYSLAEDEYGIEIYVHKILTGDEKGDFVAIPRRNFMQLPKEKYRAFGKTKEEALQKLLDIIDDTPLSEIYEEYEPT